MKKSPFTGQQMVATPRIADRTSVALLIRLAAVVTGALGVSVVAGWMFDLALLKSVVPGAVEMKANTAVGLLLAGCALFILGDQPRSSLQRLAQTLALAVGALGLTTLGEYAFGWQLGIDELLFRDTANAYNFIPGRMSPYSAVAFACIGLALAALPWRGLRPLVWLFAVLVNIIGTISLVGYLWNARELVTDQMLPPVAIHTALAFILLGTSTLLASWHSETQHKPGLMALARIETKILAGLISVLIVLLIGGGYTYRASVGFEDSAQWATHAEQVHSNLTELYTTITSAESAQRSYLLTGAQENLDDGDRLSAQARALQEVVRRLVADDPVQSHRVEELGELIADRFRRLSRGIAHYQQGQLARVRESIRSGRGAQNMQAIKSTIERIDTTEGKLLAERQANFMRARQFTLVALLITLAVAVGIVIMLFRGIRSEMAARTKAEQDLGAAKEVADSANRAKSTFLATMSHEIRTPMNGVLGMLELLSMTRLDAEQHTTLEVVRESGKSLLRIIDDILDFSKIEAGKLEVHPEAASIKEVIKSVQNIYAGSASSKGLLIKHSVDPQISPAVLVDALRLRQILNNFVSNALKFTTRGSIEIKAELIGRAEGADRVQFSVTDTGIGISVENQQRLFQPFSQAEGDTTRRFGGTGLGLTICRRLADMMGGSVEMVSELGKGTTMILNLSLPIADPKDLPQADSGGTRDLLSTTTDMRRIAPSVVQAETEGTLVLVVDDHPVNRMLLARQVNTLGYAAETAESGVDALDKWKSGRFGIVITDCNMPEMDGYELARRIREIESANGGKHTPIIACTANALGGEAEICFAAGMDDYLAKPAELKALLKKLDQWLPIPRAMPSEGSSKRPDAPPPGAGATELLDRLVLAAISGGDAPAERDILIAFRRVNDEDGAMLERAVAGRDIPQVTLAAHRIKGASVAVGALGLAGLCERIEQASRADDWKAIEASMGAFHYEWMRLNAYFDSL